MRLFTGILLLWLMSLSAFAHLGSLSGVVYDASTHKPMGGASVVLTGTNYTTITNELGQFRFSNLTPALYRIEFSHLGYQCRSVGATVQQDQTTFMTVQLTFSPIQLSEVVVSAQRAHDQQLISGLDIRLRPITNSQEILRLVPGLFIGQHAGGGKAEQLFLRGFDLDHGTDIRLSVDGMPVNMVSHAHGQGYADLHFVIPELIENVNFKKGPYQTEQGNLATAGWVNFQTRTTLDKNFVKLEAGQFNTYRAVAGVNLLSDKAKVRQQSAYLASEYNYSDSYFDHPQHFKRLNILGKYHGHLGEHSRLTLTASTFYSQWNHSGQIPIRAVESGLISWFGSIDPSEGGQTSRTNVNAELVTVTPRNHTIKNQVFYSNYTFELYSNFTFFKEDSLNGDQLRQKEHRNLLGYNGSYSFLSTWGQTRWTTTLGLQYRQDLTRHTELSHTKDRSITLQRKMYGNINEMNAAAYADELIQLSDRFSLNAGVRLDVFRNQYENLLLNPIRTSHAGDAIVSPKLNLYYTAHPGLQVYLNTGKGFHSNDTRVVVAQNGRQVLPAAYGSDLGIIYKPFSKLLVQAAAWYLWSEQEFIYVGDEGVVEPSGKSVRKGLDISMRYQITPKLFADVDFNTTRPRALGEAEGQNYLPLAPILTTTGGLSYQSLSGISGSLRYRYLGNRPANEDNSIIAQGYFITDLQLNYTKPWYQVGLSIQNVFNTKWKETQFATESRLPGETSAVNEIHFTPGTPFFARIGVTFFW